MVVGFAYIEGFVVGIIANQPNYFGGISDSDSSNKAARFIRYCDAFNIPLLTLVDTPGFLPGPDEEQKGIIRHGSKLIYAYAESTVSKITIIVRKAYGGAYLAMSSKHLGADFIFAWPNAEIAIMGAEGAIQILFSKELAVNNDKEYIKNLIEKYKQEYMTPRIAAEKGYITEIIKPEETRSKVTRCFQILKDKHSEVQIKKKHGNIPL
jgi:acetyl-CoA carboxylase carboxyltransferase component